MHLSAILVAGNSAPSAMDAFGARPLPAASLACVDIFGESVLDRFAVKLRQNGVQCTVIAPSSCGRARRERQMEVAIADNLDDRWSLARRALNWYARQGVEAVLVAELGAYAEFDVADAVEFHKHSGQTVTPICDDLGPLGYWIVDAHQVISNRNLTLPLGEDETCPAAYSVGTNYVNRLENVHDFRRLAVDAFTGRCSIERRGREIKPGVWVDEGVRLHKTARLVAPVYVGRNATIERSALITRFSSLERNCAVGQGCTVSHTSVLPHTSIGKGLDLSSAVVDGAQLSDLRRGITLTIEDAKFIATNSTARPRQVRTASLRAGEFAGQPRQPEAEYSQYLTRAAGRLFEAFKGEA